MNRNRQGRGRNGKGQGYGKRQGAEASFGQGRGGRGFGRGRGIGWQSTDPENGIRWNQPLSNFTEGLAPAEKKSWLENFKAHLTRRMSEVDEELQKF